MDGFVSARDLSKSFGSVQAVRELSLQVQAGEIYGLVGADGAGKTTTIRLLCGALRADAGEVIIAGYDIQKQTELARTHIGYLSQRFSLYEDLTVLENIHFFAEVRGLRANEWYPRCMEILDFVGLADFKDRFAGKLSGGMRQKLGLATALVSRPQVLLLDEPTTGVDPVTRQDFWQLIIRLVSTPEMGERVAVLVSTPYMDEAVRCHRIGFMGQGRLIQEGTPGQLRSLLDGRILELRGSPLSLLKQIAAKEPGVEDVCAFGDRLHIRVKDQHSATVIQNLRSSIPDGGGVLLDARSVPPMLEDVFIALTSQKHE